MNIETITLDKPLAATLISGFATPLVSCALLFKLYITCKTGMIICKFIVINTMQKPIKYIDNTFVKTTK
jgi:hypothetical protein